MLCAIVITLHAVFVQALPLDDADLKDVALGMPGQVMRRPVAASGTCSVTILPKCTSPKSLRPQSAMRFQRPLRARGAGVVARGYLEDWENQKQELVQFGLRQVSCDNVLRMVRDEGGILCDVRQVEKYEKLTPNTAINVPAYATIMADQFDTPTKAAKQAILALAGMRAQQTNPNFTAEAEAKLPRDKPIIVICDKGGNYMDSDPGQAYSQSLQAAYRLIKLGYKELYVLKGGLNEYRKQGLPCWQEDDGEPGEDDGLGDFFPDDNAERSNSIFGEYYFAAVLASASVMLAVIGFHKSRIILSRVQGSQPLMCS